MLQRQFQLQQLKQKVEGKYFVTKKNTNPGFGEFERGSQQALIWIALFGAFQLLLDAFFLLLRVPLRRPPHPPSRHVLQTP